MSQLSRRRVAVAITDRLLAGESQKAVLTQLAAYLVENRLVSQADRFIDEIEQLLTDKGYIVADVVTAHQLDDDLRTLIKSVIGSGAQQVALREHIDESLIGGVVITMPGGELDASVRTKLRRLRTTKTLI